MWKSMEEMTVLQAVQAPKICKYLAMFMSIALIVQAAGFMFWFTGHRTKRIKRYIE